MAFQSLETDDKLSHTVMYSVELNCIKHRIYSLNESPVYRSCAVQVEGVCSKG